MKKRLLLALLTAMTVAGCTEEAEDAVRITSSTIVEIYAVAGQSTTIDFQTSASWTASCSAGWLSFSPAKGEAGSHTIKLMTTDTNRTKSSRSAQFNIRSGSMQKTVTVVQSGEYAYFEQEEYKISAAGGTFHMNFKTNIENGNDLKIGWSKLNWIGWADDTRAEYTGKSYDINVKANTSEESRTAVFMLGIERNQEWIVLDTAFVYQEGIYTDYESTDYSADGRVDTLQKATMGKGIPFVLMGDGFADKDINNGTYARAMEKAFENLFSEEPVKSLRSYFDVYMVTAVSKNGVVGSDYTTAFSCVPSRTSSAIEFKENKVYSYLNKVKGIDTSIALSIIIVNYKGHNGVTTLYYDPDTKQPLQRSIALCSIIGNLDNEAFRQVLVHEAIGHGLAKLADEYGYEKNGAATSTEVSQIAWNHRYNWMVNVDTSDDPTSVIWSPFINDSHFASEHIGIYEGAYTYNTGVFRPTEESMMRSNESPFNAPSRKAIYDKVMMLGEGRSISTMEEFTEFDDAHKPAKWDYSTTRSLAPWQRQYLVSPIIKWAKK